MSNKSLYIFFTLTTIFSFVIGLYLYPILPSQLASHWNSAGQVDGYIGKFWGLFMLPLISVFIFLLFLFLQKIDPLKENINSFRKEYNLFIVLIVGFLFAFYLLSIAWNIGYRFNFSFFAILILAILFFLIGMILPKTKRNWFIGIRTPWTLSSDNVWYKTHRHGGVVFKVASLLSLIGLLFPQNAIFIAITPLVVGSIWLFVYSFLLYRKEQVGN